MLTPNSEEWLSQGIGEWNLKCICSEFQLCCLCLIDLFFLCEGSRRMRVRCIIIYIFSFCAGEDVGEPAFS